MIVPTFQRQEAHVQFSLRLLTHRVDLGAEFVSAEGIAFMARAAERAGFDSVNLTHHWIPEEEWLRTGGIHPLDPWVALTAAAMATTRLRVMTNVCIIPYQSPFIVAKSAMTLDVLSGGRLILGVGAGFLEAEFAALGVDFRERNDIMDEALRAMKLAWTGKTFDFQGKHFAARNMLVLPRPVQEPHPPIWVGGNAKRAIRRAVDLADGWIPIPVRTPRTHTPPIESLEDLRERIDYMREYAASVGRKTSLRIVTAAGDLDFSYGRDFDHGKFLDRLHALKELGVTYMTTHLPARSRAEYAENAQRFGEQVVRKMAD